MNFTCTMSNTEIVAELTEKLGGIDSRLRSNWIIENVKATYSPINGYSKGNTYVRVTLNNLNGIIFFDDLRDLERNVKRKIRGAYNFAMMKTSPSKPMFSFCV